MEPASQQRYKAIATKRYNRGTTCLRRHSWSVPIRVYTLTKRTCLQTSASGPAWVTMPARWAPGKPGASRPMSTGPCSSRWAFAPTYHRICGDHVQLVALPPCSFHRKARWSAAGGTFPALPTLAYPLNKPGCTTNLPCSTHRS